MKEEVYPAVLHFAAEGPTLQQRLEALLRHHREELEARWTAQK